MTPPGPTAKDEVREFWDRASCGEVYAIGETLAAQLDAQARERYRLEPYLPAFAGFPDGAGRDVLEIGVGMGADHMQWARAGCRSLTGIDLTPRAIDLTRARFEHAGLRSDLRVADAEQLPFPDASFDLVYSYGVLHHSPDTARAIDEVHRVLRPGGTARVMIYHKWSIVGLLLWGRYGLAAGNPGASLTEIYAKHLESPGTKAYTVDEARAMFGRFGEVDARSQLSFGDLLEGEVGQRHGSRALRLAKRVWPRWLIRRAFPRLGLILLIDAKK